MQYLQNNCRIGKISVFPNNWKSKKAPVNIPWRINYWFYDDNLGVKKQVQLKGMNEFETVTERQLATKLIIQAELDRLKNKALNPVTKRMLTEDILPSVGISELSTLPEAMDFIYKSIDVAKSTLADLKCIIKYMKEAVTVLNLSSKSISYLKRKDFRAMFEYLSIKYKWSPNTYNRFRNYTMLIYSELMEYDVIEYNIIRDIKKKKTIKKIKILLTDDDREIINQKLPLLNRRFWLFINIFFHSGSRITEFCRLKLSDIDLDKQEFKILVKKGKYFKEYMKPIKEVALPFWQEYLQGYTDKDLYFLSDDLRPGPNQIRSDQITKRWKLWVKKKLNIEADFYSLKHLNSDEVSAAIGIQKAQLLNSHTSTSTTKIYAINEYKREMEAIKNISNPL